MKKIIKSLVFASLIALASCAPTQLRSSRFDALKPGTALAIFHVKANVSAQTFYDLSRSPKMVVTTAILRGNTAESSELVIKKFAGDVIDDYAYVILPVSAEGERYTALAYKLNGSAVSSQFTFLCSGHESPTFVLKEGEVAYVGDYLVLPKPRGFEHSFIRDTKRAIKDILSMHPELSASLHEADLINLRMGYFGESDCY
jgi:hypothetical protein